MGEIDTILGQARKAGYRLTRETKKLAEFESPGGRVVYVVKTTSRMNCINLMVHPSLMPDTVATLPGVAAISEEHRFHSNMARFPKRLNRGKTETAYGWNVSLDTLGDLSRFLAAFTDSHV